MDSVHLNPASKEDSGEHYLKRELYREVMLNPEIFEFIQGSMLDGIWYWDLENPEHEWHSPRFGELFGYQAAEVPDSPNFCRENCFPEDFAAALENVKRHCADQSEPFSQVLRYRHRNGSTVWVRCRGFAIRDENGKPTRMIGANTDITELKEAELKLEENRQKLSLALKTTTEIQDRLVNAERLKALGQMSSSIAHEFNNLLAKMQGLINEIKPDDSCDPTAFEQLDELVDEGSTIVRSLGNFHPEKPSSERIKIVPLDTLIDETIQLTRPHWHNQMQTLGTRVRIETRYEEDIQVQVDPAQFREVLTNLILNSCDALGDDGLLTFTTRRQGHSIVFELSDNGHGMSEESLRRCLDTFYSTKGDQSTGLGLSLSETIIRGFGGELKIQSTPQIGTTVTVRLPKPGIHRAASQSGETSPAPEKSSSPATGDTELERSLRCLVVDDEPIIARMIAQLLAVDGHHAEFVTSAGEALDSLASRPFDAVLSDRSMPQMNGDQLAAEVATKFPGKTFVMVTGYGDMMTENAERPDGVDLVLGKPVDRDALRNATRLIASRSTALAG